MGHVSESCHTHQWVMSHVWVSHVGVSCQTYEWVMSHVWVSHVGEPCHTYEWVMSHVWVSHVGESCHTYEWVMSHVWVSHVGESCHICEWVITHMWVSHVTHSYELCVNKQCNGCACICTMRHITVQSASYHCTIRHSHDTMRQIPVESASFSLHYASFSLNNASDHCRNCVISHTARKPAWNPAGVEPVHWKPADITDINPGSLKSVQMRNALEFRVNGTNQKHGGIRGRKPAPKKLLGRYEWVMSHVWVSQVSHMSESCLIYEWVISHSWEGHVTLTYWSCHIHLQQAYSRRIKIWVSHVTCWHESCVKNHSLCVYRVAKTHKMP